MLKSLFCLFSLCRHFLLRYFWYERQIAVYQDLSQKSHLLHYYSAKISASYDSCPHEWEKSSSHLFHYILWSGRQYRALTHGLSREMSHSWIGVSTKIQSHWWEGCSMCSVVWWLGPNWSKWKTDNFWCAHLQCEPKAVQKPLNLQKSGSCDCGKRFQNGWQRSIMTLVE